MEKHTVCLLNDSFPPLIDGVANAVLNYALQIEKEHGHAMVVTPEVPGADDASYPFPVYRYPSLDIRKQLGYVAGYPFSPEVDRKVRAEAPEILHLHCPATSAFLARMMRHTLDVPLVFTYHTKYDVDIANAIRSRTLQKGAVSLLVDNVSSCDEVWVVSRGAGENLRSLGYEGDYIVMENGVDVPRGRVSGEKVRAATAGWDLPGGVPLFLFVGRLMWYKGIRIILDALATLKAEGIPFRMVFIGAGTDEKEIRAYVDERDLGSLCFFTGAIRDRETLRAWYTRADLFLFPSSFDTNGLVVREAAAADLPSVIIRDSCAAEGVTDGRNGFLIGENAEAMAAKLKEILSSPECLKKVGKGAGDELYCSWADAVARAADRYETVIDRYRSGFYVRSRTLSEDLFRSRGESMERLGRIDGALEQLTQPLEEKLREAKDQAGQHLKDTREKLQDTKERMQEAGEQFRRTAEQRLEDLKRLFSDDRDDSSRYL